MKIRKLIERRKEIRSAWRADARELIERDEVNAYYNAQRLVARTRGRGGSAVALHWAKVAAEIARVSQVARMDWETLTRIAREEG